MNPTERFCYWLMVALFFLAFIRMYRRWLRTGEPQVKFAGKFFLVFSILLMLLYRAL